MLFISHSSKNNSHAERVRDWLVANGWGKEQIYLDLTALSTGAKWRAEINEAISASEAVIVCLSDDWISSTECAREFGNFESAGKLILPILVEKTSQNIDGFVADFQMSDVSDEGDNHTGFEQLRLSLLEAGIGPRYFPWPPPDELKRAPYRGLEALTEKDAAVFFGRNREIAAGLDTLRQMRLGIRRRLLVIAAPSGAGKSSFLNAGLLPRLRRESRSFVILPTIRGSDSALHTLTQRLGLDQDAGNEELLAEFRRFGDETHSEFNVSNKTENTQRQKASPVLAIDQGEEIFSADEFVRTELIDLLAICFERIPEFIAIISVRVDFLALLQSEKRISGHIDLFNLPLLNSIDFREIIEGPAALMRPAIDIEPELTERLIHDLDGADALPLLAFALQRLYERVGRGQRLGLQDYVESMGGFSGVIAAAVDAALKKAKRVVIPGIDNEALLKMIRSVFIPWLVQLDESDSSPRRRVAKFDEIPAKARPIVSLLIDERLLSTSNVAGERCLEVVHEAVLRDWEDLHGWIRDEAAALVLLQGIKRATVDWQKANDTGINQQDMLVHRGERLKRTMSLLDRQDFSRAVDGLPAQYIAACQLAEEIEQSNAIEQTQQLLKQTDIANSERYRAEVGRLIMLAQQSRQLSLAGQSTLGLLLAIEAISEARARSIASAHSEAALISALLNHKEYQILRFSDEVNQARFSPNGEHVVTASRDGRVIIWNVADGKQLMELCGHNDAVFSASYSGNGDRIVTVSADGSAILWDVTQAEIVFRSGGHDDVVIGAEFSADDAMVITASADGSVIVWCTLSGQPLHTFQVGKLEWPAGFGIDCFKAITCTDALRCWDVRSGKVLWIGDCVDGGIMNFTRPVKATQMLLASASGARNGHLWDAVSGQLVASLNGHNDIIHRLSFSVDGDRLLTMSEDSTARTWNVATGRQEMVLSGHGGAVHDGCFACNDTLIVTASSDGTAAVSESSTGQVLDVFRGHIGALWSVDVSSQGRFAVTASVDATARIWNLESNVHVPIRLTGHKAKINHLVFAPDDITLVTASSDGTVRVWDTHTGQILHVLVHEDSGVWFVDCAADGQRMLTTGVDGYVRVWDMKTGELVHLLSGHSGLVQHACFSADSMRIASAAEAGSARIWDASSGKLLAELAGHLGRINVVEFSGNGQRILTATEDGLAYLWDGVSYKRLSELSGHQSSVVNAVFSSDSKVIATISWDKTVRLWDGETGSQCSILNGHEDTVVDVDFSNDCKLVASASSDNTVRLWRVRTCDTVLVLEHGGKVTHVAFSLDGRILLCASSDGKLKLWHVESGTEVCVLEHDHDGSAIVAAQLSHNNQVVASASDDGTIRLWTLPTDLMGDWLHAALKISPRALTDNERHQYLEQDDRLVAETGLSV